MLLLRQLLHLEHLDFDMNCIVITANIAVADISIVFVTIGVVEMRSGHFDLDSHSLPAITGNLRLLHSLLLHPYHIDAVALDVH